jgi:hypothetical protein
MDWKYDFKYVAPSYQIYWPPELLRHQDFVHRPKTLFPKAIYTKLDKQNSEIAMVHN